MKINVHQEAIEFMREQRLIPHVFPLRIIELAIERGAYLVMTKVTGKLKHINQDLAYKRKMNLG